jgi:FkbM family methyltransferase
MAVFIKSLKERGFLDSLHMTIGIIGSRKVNTEDDYSQRGWQYFAPNLTIYGFDANEDACEEANAAFSQNKVVNWVEKHIPLALGKSCEERTLYVTHAPMCSSLYPPNEALLSRHTGLLEVAGLDFSVDIETTTLDQFCKEEQIHHIDFLQIDVQGADLDVLKGAVNLLSRSVLGIQIEVEFAELYEGQPHFADIDIFLRNQGFTLFDLNSIHRPKTRGPVTSLLRPGQILWGEAFYLRDPLGTDLQINRVGQTPEERLKLACMADVLGFTDYAIELLEQLMISSRPDLSSVLIESLSNAGGLSREEMMQIPVIQHILSTSEDKLTPYHE